MQIESGVPLPPERGAGTKATVKLLMSMKVGDSTLISRGEWYDAAASLRYHIKKQGLDWKYKQQAQRETWDLRIWRIQ